MLYFHIIESLAVLQPGGLTQQISQQTAITFETLIALVILTAGIITAWIRMEVKVGKIESRVDNNDNLDRQREDSLNKTMTEISNQLTKYGDQIEAIKNELHSINTYITTEKAVKEELKSRAK